MVRAGAPRCFSDADCLATLGRRGKIGASDSPACARKKGKAATLRQISLGYARDKKDEPFGRFEVNSGLIAAVQPVAFAPSLEECPQVCGLATAALAMFTLKLLRRELS
jgi:hypothetical protein